MENRKDWGFFCFRNPKGPRNIDSRGAEQQWLGKVTERLRASLQSFSHPQPLLLYAISPVFTKVQASLPDCDSRIIDTVDTDVFFVKSVAFFNFYFCENVFYLAFFRKKNTNGLKKCKFLMEAFK